MDNSTQILEFTTMDDKLVGRVTVKDGTIAGSPGFTQRLVDSWNQAGKTADDFVKRYSGYANGYVKSELITD